MSSRRTAILIGAIAIGIVAVLLIVQYVSGLEAKYKDEGEAVPVFIAKVDIKRGTDGGTAVADQSIDSAKIPRQFYPATAIQSTDAVQKKVALFDIASGTVIVNGMFVDPSTTTITFRQRLSSPKHVAISISTDPIHGVGGFLVPGDEVNMMIFQDNSKVKAAVEQPPAPEGGGANPQQNTNPEISGGSKISDGIEAKPPENYITVGGPQWIILNRTARYMYQKVKIIAVGSNQLLTPGEQAAATGGATPNAGSANILTLEVPPDAAQYVATGQEVNFYLSLVAKDYKPLSTLHPLPVVLDTLPGEDPGKLCPYWDTTTGPEETREKGCSG